MKLLFWLLPLLATCLFSGCKKDSVKKNQPPNIRGSWELRISVGMYPTQFYEAGNGRIVEFKNGTVTHYEGNKIIYSASYYLSQYKGNCEYARGRWLVHYGSNNDQEGSLVNLNKDTLSIASPPCVYDGVAGIYVKM